MTDNISAIPKPLTGNFIFFLVNSIDVVWVRGGVLFRCSVGKRWSCFVDVVWVRGVVFV